MLVAAALLFTAQVDVTVELLPVLQHHTTGGGVRRAVPLLNAHINKNKNLFHEEVVLSGALVNFEFKHGDVRDDAVSTENNNSQTWLIKYRQVSIQYTFVSCTHLTFKNLGALSCLSMRLRRIWSTSSRISGSSVKEKDSRGSRNELGRAVSMLVVSKPAVT